MATYSDVRIHQTNSGTYPVGSKVMIRIWKDKPSNWNTDMYRKMSGRTAVISNVGRGGDRDYRYSLEGYKWSWRHIDLILIKDGIVEPNLAFRMRKHGYR